MNYDMECVVCCACNRLIVPSKNGHPRRHSPHNMLQGKGYPGTRGTCAGTFEPGIDPAVDTMVDRRSNMLS